MKKTNFTTEQETLTSIVDKTKQWTITYGDLMSTLMILFLMLYAF
jgi:flagellar motor protein MotB